MLANGMPIVVLCLISSFVYTEAFSFQFLKSSADEGKSTKLEASSVNDFGENDLQPDRLEQDYSQKRSIPSKVAVVGSTSNLETESEGEKTFTIWDALDVINKEDSVENNTKTDNSSSLPLNISVQVKQGSSEEEGDANNDKKPKPVNGEDVPKITFEKQPTPLNVLASGELNLDVGGQVNANTSFQQPSANNESLNNTGEPQTGGPDPNIFGNTSKPEQPSNTTQSETPVVNVVAVSNNQSNVSVEGQSNSAISNQIEAINQTGSVSSNQSAVVEGELSSSVNISNSTLPENNVNQPESSGVTAEGVVVPVNSSLNEANSTASNISEPASVGNVLTSLNFSVPENFTVSKEGEIIASLNASQPANVSLSGDTNSTLPVNETISVAGVNNESTVNVSVPESPNTSSNVSDAVESNTTVIAEDIPKPVALNVSEVIPQNSTQPQNTSTDNLNNTLVVNVSDISNTSSAGNISLEGYKNKTKTPFNITLLDISGNADSQKTDVDLQSESKVTALTNQSLSLNSSASDNSSASSNRNVEVISEVSKNNTKSENDLKEDVNVRVKRKTIAKRSVNPILVERRKRDNYKEIEELYNEVADHKFNYIIN